MHPSDFVSPKTLLDNFARDSDQASFLSCAPFPLLLPLYAYFAPNRTSQQNVLSITQHELTRIIDMNTCLSRVEILGLQLYGKKECLSRGFYVILPLRRQGENVIIWLRLEQKSKGMGLVLDNTLSSLTARLSPLKNALTREENLVYEHWWPSTVCSPTLHTLQHALCIISDSLQRDGPWWTDGSLFTLLLLKHWGICGPAVEKLFASSRHVARISAISDRIMERLRHLGSISLPSSVHSLPAFRHTASIGQFISNEFYDPCIIHSLTRYRAERRLRHEFIIVHSVDQGNHDRWFRLDRRPFLKDSFQFSAVASSSDVTAQDVVAIAVRKNTLFDTPRENTIQQAAFVAFSEGSGPRPTIRDLRTLLRSIYKIAPQYNLLKENCRFLASVVQEGFEKKFHAQLVGDRATWSKRRASEVAEEIISEAWDWGSVRCVV